MKREEFNSFGWKKGDIVKVKGYGFFRVQSVGLESGYVSVKIDGATTWFKWEEIDVCREDNGAAINNEALSQIKQEKNNEIKRLQNKIDELQKKLAKKDSKTFEGRAAGAIDSAITVIGNSTGLYQIIDRYVQNLRSACDKLNDAINSER